MRNSYDRRGLWAWRIVKRWNKFLLMRDKIHNTLLAQFWDVKIGRNCKFYGKTYFSRAVDSEITIGDHCTFRSAVRSNKVGLNRPCMISTFSSGAKVILGKNVGMSGTVIGADKLIAIGDNVLCGGNVTITDTDWHGINPEDRKKPGNSVPIAISDNVWLGLNVIVLKGVSIGKNSVIGAGSIVTKHIPENVVAAGQPARVITSL